YPRVPTETTLPPTSTPGTEQEPAATPARGAAPAPAPAPATPPAGPPQTPQAAPRQAPQTPQAQALLNRFVAAYDPLSDDDLDREVQRISRTDPGAMNIVTQYRLKAIDAVRTKRQGPGGPLDQGSAPTPGSEMPPPASSAPGKPAAQRQPQGVEQQQR